MPARITEYTSKRKQRDAARRNKKRKPKTESRVKVKRVETYGPRGRRSVRRAR